MPAGHGYAVARPSAARRHRSLRSAACGAEWNLKEWRSMARGAAKPRRAWRCHTEPPPSVLSVRRDVRPGSPRHDRTTAPEHTSVLRILTFWNCGRHGEWRVANQTWMHAFVGLLNYILRVGIRSCFERGWDRGLLATLGVLQVPHAVNTCFDASDALCFPRYVGLTTGRARPPATGRCTACRRRACATTRA